MTKPTLLALAVAAALGAAAVVALNSAEALADKTVTIRSAPSEVTTLIFETRPSGVVHARVCGRSQFSDAGVTPITCHDVTLPGAHAIATSVNALATGQARTFWMGQEGL